MEFLVSVRRFSRATFWVRMSFMAGWLWDEEVWRGRVLRIEIRRTLKELRMAFYSMRHCAKKSLVDLVLLA